jgi:hypothetical protein
MRRSSRPSNAGGELAGQHPRPTFWHPHPPEQREAQVLELCGWAHSELIYVHPFADGNGRMARSLVLWLAARYGLPVFLDLRPRPSGPSGYEMAARASMTGRHQLMRITLTKMLADYRTQHAIDTD